MCKIDIYNYYFNYNRILYISVKYTLNFGASLNYLKMLDNHTVTDTADHNNKVEMRHRLGLIFTGLQPFVNYRRLW